MIEISSKDWRFSNFDIRKYRMIMIAIIWIGFIIPTYIYLSGSYVVSESTLVEVADNEWLVDDDLYTVTEPVCISDIDDLSSDQYSTVWGDYVAWYHYNGSYYGVYLYQISTGDVTQIDSENFTYNPELCNDILVYQNKTGIFLDAIFIMNITTSDVRVIDYLGQLNMSSYPMPDYEYVAYNNWSSGAWSNITYVTLVGNDYGQVPLHEYYAFADFGDISNGVICYYVYNGTQYNITAYDISTNITTVIDFSEVGEKHFPSIWNEDVTWWLQYYGNTSVQFHDMVENETIRVDWNTDDDGSDATSYKPIVCNNMVAWGELMDGTWKILVWDSITNNTFVIQNETDWCTSVDPAMYSDGDDFIITWTEIESGRFDIYMSFINSTYEAPIDGNGDGMPDIATQTTYNMWLIYISLISLSLSGATALIFINYYDELKGSW